mgnify:CR=1 FL=1
MVLFRLFLITLVSAIVVYTAIVGDQHGWDFAPIFFGDIMAMTWPGQFNFDFMGFLLMSGVWTAWRNGFSPVGLVLGLIAFFFGVLFLATYLLVLSVVEQGDIKSMLLGVNR